MSALVVATFNTPNQAEEVRRDLIDKFGKDQLVPDEAVTVVVDEKHEVFIHHTKRLTMPTALSGGFVGTLVGLLLLNPAFALIGGITGTVLGSILGALEDVGIDDGFIKRLASDFNSKSSALFVRARSDDPSEVIHWLESRSKKVLRTELIHHDEKRLKTALKKAEDSQERQSPKI